MSTNKAKLEALLKFINSAAQEAIAEYEKAGNDVPFIDSTELHLLDNAADNITLKTAVRTLEGACAQLCAALAPPSHTAINLVHSLDHAYLRVAIQENMTDILTNYPEGIHVKDLGKILNMDARKLVRVLRLLATRGCYTEVETDTFANNRLSLVLHSENPVRAQISLHVERPRKGDCVLYETMKDPRTAFSEDPAHAPSMYAEERVDDSATSAYFNSVSRDDTKIEHFHFSMRGLNHTMGVSTFTSKFPFEQHSTFVDIGGGIGAFSLPLAKMHKHIKITIQDLPEVVNLARGVWKRDFPEAIQGNRIEFAQLDFLTQAPVRNKDIYYLRNIIHDWPDREAKVILSNVRRALGPHSRVLIHDFVLRALSRKKAEAEAASLGVAVAPEPLLPNFGVGNIRMYQMDLLLWLAFNSKERPLENVLELSTSAGLKLERVWDLVETCVLEFSGA